MKLKKALEELKGIKFDNSEMLENYLYEHGFEDAGVTRYYAYVSTNDTKTEVWIEMRPSTSKAHGFNGFYRDFGLQKSNPSSKLVLYVARADL